MFLNFVCICFPTKENSTKKKSILTFFGFFGQKQPISTKNEENLQDQNCSLKFSETLYLNVSSQKRIEKKKNRFWHFLAKKTAIIDQKFKKIGKIQTF